MFTDYFESLATPASDAHMYDLVAEEERKKFVCKQPGCGKIFRYKSEIERHIATHSESRPFICQYDNCFKAFKRSDALENHIRSSHTKETPFACPFPECGMKFTTHGSFRYHVLKHNKQTPDGESFLSTKEVQPSPAQPRKQVKLSPEPEASFTFNQGPLKTDPFFQKLGKEDFGDDFFAPAPRFASKIQWEMVNDDTETSSPRNEDSQTEKLTQVVEENKVLKDKLNVSEKVIKSMQKQINDLLGSLFAYQSQIDTLPSQTTFPDFLTGNFTQDTSVETDSKAEEPLLDMINYGDMNLPSPLETKFNRESSSIDAFLSFGNFDF